MTNLAEQFSHRRPRSAPNGARPAVTGSIDPAISPQDFYREMTEREDMQRILTRLAQVKDDRP